MDMKRFFLYAIAIAALALAGCGGNGAAGLMEDDPCMTGYERPSAGAPCMKKVTDDGVTTGMFASFLNATPMQAAMAIVADPMDPLPLDGDEDRLRPNSPRNEGGDFDDTAGVRPLTLMVDNKREVTVTEGTNPFIASDHTIADLGADWYGDAQMRTVNNQVDMVVTYTNAEGLGPLAWATYFSGTDSRPGTGSGGADETSGAVMLVVADDNNTPDVNELEALLDLITVPAFPTGDRQNFQFVDDGTTDDMDEAQTPGMFMVGTSNIPGTFECTAGNGCTVTTDDEGNISSFGGDWTFTPTVAMGSMLSDLMVMGVAPDGDYLSFGYWVQASGDADNPFGISTFAMGSEPFSGTLATLMGSAEYNGPATGMFVKKTDGVPSHAGQFTANATLTANFGATMENMINVNDAYTVSGTVDSFEGDGVGDWTVELMQARFTEPMFNPGTGVVEGHADYMADFNGDTTGGGGWRGEFFGNPEPADPSVEATEYPTGVAGEFDAHFDDGHVIGAFGAEQ